MDTATDVVDGDFTIGNLALREALFFANLDPLANTITFDASLSGQTITLGGSECAASSFRELCERRTGLHDMALVATEQIGITNLGDVGQSLLAAPTLRRSLTEFRKIIGTQTSNLAIELHARTGGHLAFGHRAESEIVAGEWHRALYTLTWMLKVVRLADPTWSPAEIWIDSKATPERQKTIESLGSAPRFGQQTTGFLVPAGLLATPLARPAGQIARAVEDEQLQSTSPSKTFAGSLKQLIRSYARDGWLNIERRQ